MEPLALSSFEISGFRAFEQLDLERLGRVNLLVGKNNVGKSSLLEALWVYANQGSPWALRSLLENRAEVGSLSETRATDDNLENQNSSFRYLFYGRKDLKPGVQIMKFGPKGKPDRRVIVRFIWIEIIEGEEGSRVIREVDQPGDNIEINPGLAIQAGKSSILFRLNRLFLRSLRESFPIPMERPCVFLPANGLSMTDIAKYWDNITLGPQEIDVLNTLKILEPSIERINLIGTQTNSRINARIPIVKTSSFDAPIPLKSLGEGMNRIFGVALALVNAKNGILLVDEIESGLHYSILPEVWRFIFQAAKQLNVQVFATTHSWDCITGFQQAAQESDQDGMLIRLANKRGKIIPTFFDEKELAIVTREQIEVR